MDCNQIINAYLQWIKDNTVIKSIKDGETCEVTTPFLDRHNDHLQVYILKQPNGGFVLSDDGYILQDLTMSGVDLNTPKRQMVFHSILNGFGAKVDDKHRVYIEANTGNIGQKKHAFIQAMLAVNDMYTLSQESVYSFFKEDVEQYFKLHNIYYTKDIKITGKTGFDHTVDFLIAATRTHPERLIKTVNNPVKDPISSALFSFSDIEAIREQKPKNYVIYNDQDKEVSADVISAIKNWGVIGVPWSKRDKYRPEFLVN